MMKTMKLLTKIIPSMALAVTIWGCGKVNDAAPAVSASGQHPALAVWYVDHRAAYAKDPQQCTACHGGDLKGGIAKVDCFTGIEGIPGFPCHSNGHAPRTVPHPVPFKDPALHGPAAKADFIYCQSCHGTAAGPGGNPRFNVAIGTLANGCEDCHLPKSAHPPVDPAKVPGFPASWPGHAGAGNMSNACILCHGATLRGPAEGGVGPACSSCHTGLAAGSIPTPGTCTSCHGKPPASGSHAVHNGLAGVTDVCNSCHNGAGSGTAKHDNGIVDVAFLASYNARSGSATFNANKSCANVSCHGGVTTPVWGGSIDVASQCTVCHVAGTASQTPQYNSYWSGQHTFHLTQVGMVCSDCHDMSVTSGGASHFSGLSTQTFELAPRFTIRVPGYATTPGSCNPTASPAAGTFSIGVCHGTRSW